MKTLKTSIALNPVGGNLSVKARQCGVVLYLTVGKRELILNHSEAVDLAKLAKGKRSSVNIGLGQVHGGWPIDIRLVYGDEFITLHFDKWNWPFPVQIPREEFEVLADELLSRLEELAA